MKVLVIPDVHLKPYMFEWAEKLLNVKVADTAVCLMDLADDWNKGLQLDLYRQIYNSAIDFAQKFPEAKWCYGNHDLSYLWGEMESGFSGAAAATVQEGIARLNGALPDDNPIRYIQRIDNVIFSHGGISEDFVRRHIIPSKVNSSNPEDVQFVIDEINVLWRNDMWRDDSPIWFRPQSGYAEYMPVYLPEGYLQVVGHTPVEDIQVERGIVSCDVFSTYADGKPIGCQEFPIVDTETFEVEAIGVKEIG